MDIDEEPRPLIFREEVVDGMRRVFVVNGWPDVVTIDGHLLRQPAPSQISLVGDDLRFAVANGDAHYRRVGTSDGHSVFRKLAAAVEMPQS